MAGVSSNCIFLAKKLDRKIRNSVSQRIHGIDILQERSDSCDEVVSQAQKSQLENWQKLRQMEVIPVSASKQGLEDLLYLKASKGG